MLESDVSAWSAIGVFVGAGEARRRELVGAGVCTATAAGEMVGLEVLSMVGGLRVVVPVVISVVCDVLLLLSLTRAASRKLKVINKMEIKIQDRLSSVIRR
jgi:UPF0716 family protein affecting phage T7 exclusion